MEQSTDFSEVVSTWSSEDIRTESINFLVVSPLTSWIFMFLVNFIYAREVNYLKE